MQLTRKHWAIIGSVAGTLIIGLIIGATVGIVNGRKRPEIVTVEKRALEILRDNPLIDGHNDLPWLIRANFQNKINDLDLYDMTKYKLKNSTPSHTDITRLRMGQVGGQFWSIYTDCKHQGKDAIGSFLEQIDVMNRIIAQYPDVFQMARTADEIREAFRAKRIASLYGVEGGQAIDSSLSILRILYQLGVRYMTLTHNCNNPWIDQNQVDIVNSTLVKNGGLTQFGRKVILEMNRLGMLVDLSHVSKQAMIDVLGVTRSPIIFSHSSAHALCNHTRNVHDDVLRSVKKNQGIVMVTFVPSFVTCKESHRGSIVDIVEHIKHIRNIVGIDGIGLGGDYDGISSTPEQLEDVSKYPKLIEYLLLNENWSHEDVIKFIGGNILRVLEKNEQIAQELQKTMKPQEDLIEYDDLAKHDLAKCRYLDMYSTKTNVN